MTISQDGANSLSNQLNANFDSITSNLNSTIATYSSNQNEIWRSTAASLFAGEINETLVSVNQALSALNERINSKFSSVAQIHNDSEQTSVTFPRVSYTSVSKNVEPDESWAGNKTGVLEGHSVAELKPHFNSIIQAVQDDLKKVRSTIEGNTMLDGGVKDSFNGYIAEAESKLASELSELNDSFNNRIQGEDSNKVSAEEIAKSTASAAN